MYRFIIHIVIMPNLVHFMSLLKTPHIMSETQETDPS